MITLQVFSYLTGVADMNPEVEKLISQVIGEVQRKSLFEAKLDAIEEGRKEGRKVGRKEGKEEVAKNLRGVIADEEISRVSGLSLERVKQL
jgi:predicted transposase/invertase (TIGR01784 family)